MKLRRGHSCLWTDLCGRARLLSSVANILHDNTAINNGILHQEISHHLKEGLWNKFSDFQCWIFRYSSSLQTFFRASEELCNICGFHGGHHEECRLLGYKNPVHTSQETHYVSSTESSQLMLCKIWGFHGSDYEECCLLGYKNPVRTSQESHYVSATKSSHLMVCKIWGFHGGDYEEWRLLGCYAVWLL
jgi:hypothetical protein